MKTTNKIPLYLCFIHYNEFEKTWNVFSREEQHYYLNEPKKMKTLMRFNSFEELTEVINESLKTENND